MPNWSSLNDGDVFGVDQPSFDPASHILIFDDASIRASAVRFSFDGLNTSVSYGGKTVFLDVAPYVLYSGNIDFTSPDGGDFYFGNDHFTGPVGDDTGNTPAGGAGDDWLSGGGGDDLVIGNDGDDVLAVFRDGSGIAYGNDTLNGGTGTDIVDYVESSEGVTVFLGNETANGGATDGDGASAVFTLIGIEGVRGTPYNDTLNANSFTKITGRISDIVQFFDGGAANDTIYGANGDGRATVLSYERAIGGINVNLGSNTASNDGYGSVDTVYEIDGVIGSAFNDFIGGSNSGSNLDEVFQFHEGMAGNDTLDGAARFAYDHSPYGVVVNLSESAISGNFYGAGTITVNSYRARDGWDSLGGGTDSFGSFGIDARGSKFNDTIVGSDEEDNWFEGGGGDDYIDGRGGIDDHEDTVEYLRATGGVYVNFALGTAQGIGGDNGVGVDTLLNLEDVRGSDFADSLVGGGTGAHSLYHVEGFEGRAGNDTLNGGDADPLSLDITSYELSPSAVVVNLSSAAINVGGSVGANRARDGYGVGGNPHGIDRLVNINSATGSRFDDYLLGSSGDNWFQGLAGDDTIIGGAGIDTLICDTPDDLLVGVTVNLATGIVTDAQGDTDTVSGIEIVWGTFEDDVIIGDSNDNQIDGDGGDNTINGGGGTDTALYQLEESNVTANLATGVALDGFGYTDTLISIENLVGSEFNDHFTGSASANRLEGGAGNDTLDGGGGPDTMIGGSGNDTYIVNHAGDKVVETADGGNDTVITSVSMGLPLHVENILFTGGASLVITGNAQSNVIGGGSGDDTLNGGAGIDTVSYTLSTVAVTVNLATDTATGNGDDVLSGFENATGGTKADTLIGDSGRNVLDGRQGADIMRGGFGNDTYIVDRLADKVVETSNTAAGGLVLPGNDGAGQAGVAGITDTVIAAVNYTLATLQYLENLTLSGAASRATGNALANKLTGNAGSDTLEGGTGNDTLNGGAGSDRLLGGGGNDTLVWGTGDTLDGGIGVDNLKLAAGNLNLVTLANNKILNVETINMIGGGNNTLTLNLQDVLAISSTTNTLKVLGNAGDTVNAAGFTQGADLQGFNRYSNGGATLLVDTDVTVTV